MNTSPTIPRRVATQLTPILLSLFVSHSQLAAVDDACLVNHLGCEEGECSPYAGADHDSYADR
jgi:hypothetical protein